MSLKNNIFSIVQVLWAIRDSKSTKGAARQLLVALALRCSPKQNYCCWPSYRQLAEDCQLDPATLKRAAASLENAGLVKRIVRKNRSNRFFIIVSKLQEQAKAQKEAKEAAKQEATDEEFPLGVDHDDPEDEQDNSSEWMTGGNYDGEA